MQDFNNINIWNKRLESQKNIFEYLNWLLINYDTCSYYRQTSFLDKSTYNTFKEFFSLLNFNKIIDLSLIIDNGCLHISFEYNNIEVDMELCKNGTTIIFSENRSIEYAKTIKNKELKYILKEKLIDYNYVK